MSKKSKKRDKVYSFMCAFCGVPKHHNQFTLCEYVQEHIRNFPPRKRNPHCTGKCDACYEKEMIASLPLKGWWTSFKNFFSFNRKPA